MSSAAKSGSFTTHNKVRLVKSGSDYFDLLEQLIREARYSIHLQTYIFSDDETGRRIANGLIEAAQRNVQVYLVVDGYASQDLSSEFIESLVKAKIHFRWFDAFLKSKYFYLGRRLHHKVLVIDGEHGLVGGINISDHYNDTTLSTAWLDYAIYIQGEAVQELLAICERRTVLRTSFFKKENNIARVIKGDWSSYPVSLVGVRVNDWVRRKREITNSYLDTLRKAKSNVMIMSPYFLPGRVFLRTIIAAAKRGVNVKLILPGVSDIALAKYAERYVYSRLFHKNIEIYEYQKKVLHGKLSTSDGQWITAGSYNINNISTYASIELNLEIENSHFANEVSEELASVIEQDCTLITESEYNAGKNFIKKILQRGAYDIYRLLFFLFTFYFKQHRE